MKSVYRQFTDKIAADASRSAFKIPQPSVFEWLTGDWTWLGKSVHFANTRYGVSLNGDPFLIYNGETNMWILIADPDAFGIMIGLGMRNGQARFTGTVTIDDQSVRLRQTWRILQEFAVEIENERYSAGDWQFWSHAVLERTMPKN